jgi:adenylate cyclase
MSGQLCEIGVLFGDVAGSTRLYDALGDRAAYAAIETCLRLMREATAAQGGTVVKTVGDEVMGAFRGPAATFNAAVAMQRAMQALPAVSGARGETKLALRVGFHFGPALAENGDFYGDTVNIAARMVGLARAWQILTTDATARLLPASQRSLTRALDELPVKGKAEAIAVVELLWREDASESTTFFTTRPLGTPARAANGLRLKHHEREWLFDHGRETIALGREPTNDIVVSDHRASRKHATIERRGEKWVLIDHSTNGTFVTFTEGQRVGLRHEELILHGAGVISFGDATSGAAPNAIGFTLS